MASGTDTRPAARAPLVRVALAFCIGIGLSGCGGGDGAAPTAAPPSTPPPPPAPTVASLEVSGTAVLTSIGETTQFMVTATLSDGSMQAVEAAEADWESSDPAVATVSEGVLTAAGGGNATITVTFGGQSAEVAVSVRISLRIEGTVRVLYVSPADRQFRADYSEGIAHALVDLQSWYRRQTGGLTFSLYDATPEHCRLPEPSDYYAQGHAWEKIQEDVQPCAPVEYGRANFVWVLYVDVEEACGEPHELGRGGNGITMMPRGDLDGLTNPGTFYYCDEGPYEDSVGSRTGGAGHELAHAIADLRHPPGCDEGLPSCDPVYWSLMHLGYTTYPDTYLLTEDKETLLRSPFVEGEQAPDREAPGALGGPRVQGTVRGPSGVPLEGIRISVWGDVVWNWGETAADGTFDVGMPAGSPDSAVVSVHAGKAADCRWLGYHGEGGLIGLRENATRVAIGDADVTGIEIRLPGDPDALCAGQRTLSGRVLGRDRRPVAEVLVGFSDEWILTGRDGTFVVRGPQGLREGVGIEVPECGYVGSYGPGGFTTVESESWWVELGATDVTGMRSGFRPAPPNFAVGNRPRDSADPVRAPFRRAAISVRIAGPGDIRDATPQLPTLRFGGESHDLRT